MMILNVLHQVCVIVTLECEIYMFDLITYVMELLVHITKHKLLRYQNVKYITSINAIIT